MHFLEHRREKKKHFSSKKKKHFEFTENPSTYGLDKCVRLLTKFLHNVLVLSHRSDKANMLLCFNCDSLACEFDKIIFVAGKMC